MQFKGKKINIALLITGYKKLSAYSAQYEGVVKAPSNMAGQAIKIILNNHAVWSIRDVRSPDQVIAYANRLGYSGVAEFVQGVDEHFDSMATLGTLAVFQSCLVSEHDPLVWSSWIADAVGFVPPNDALYGYARLTAKKNGAGADKVVADFLYPELSASIRTLEDLKLFFKEHLSATKDGLENNGNCLFRIKSKHSHKATCFWVFVARKDVVFSDDSGRERKFSVPAAMEQTWQEAVIDGVQSGGLCRVVAHALGEAVVLEAERHQELSAEIAQGLAQGIIEIQAIAGQRHRLIGNVLRNVGDSASHLSQAIRSCDLPDGQGVGFFPMIAIVNHSVPASVRFVKGQAPAVVVNRVFHDVEGVAHKAEAIPFLAGD